MKIRQRKINIAINTTAVICIILPYLMGSVTFAQGLNNNKKLGYSSAYLIAIDIIAVVPTVMLIFFYVDSFVWMSKILESVSFLKRSESNMVILFTT